MTKEWQSTTDEKMYLGSARLRKVHNPERFRGCQVAAATATQTIAPCSVIFSLVRQGYRVAGEKIKRDQKELDYFAQNNHNGRKSDKLA